MNRTRWIAVAVLAVVVLGGAWVVKSRAKNSATKYRTAAVERGDVTATVSATGSVEPVLQVQVGSQVSGTLSKLYVDYNSQVKAGEVLGQIETSSFRARLAQAEAAVAHAKAALTNGQLALKRTIELQKGNFVAQADVDAAQSTVDQEAADLKQAQASLESAQVDLDHTTITSPINGVVISRSIDVGQTVAASLQAPQLFLIGNDLKQMQVETNIDEADIGSVHPGETARFTVDAYPDANFTGKVVQVRLVPQVSSNVVTYTTVISARNDDLRLRPGMTANVTIELETHTSVLKVVNAALRFKPPGYTGGRGRGGMGGAGGANGAVGGIRRGFASLISRLVPSAYAQDAPQQGGGGSWAGANDPYVQQIRAKVKSGELTREQAHDLIQKHMQQGAPAPGGAKGAAGKAPTKPGQGARATKGAAGAQGAAGAAGGAAPGGNAWAGRVHGNWQNLQGLGANAPSAYKPGSLWILKDGKPTRVGVMTGLSDGTSTEIQTDKLKEGDLVITGIDSGGSTASALTPPPGMGGPTFRGPGGGGGGGGRR